MYIINWLSKKSIPKKDGKKGETAGYLFYETSEGFHFKSIDSLFAQKQEKSFGFTFGHPKHLLGYDGNIINFHQIII